MSVAATMDATMPAEGTSTPQIQVPGTPQPHNAELPTSINTAPIPPPSAIAPTPSIPVISATSPEVIDMDTLNAPTTFTGKTARGAYKSPTPPNSSMTPPPSTQSAKRAASPASISTDNSRSITPTPGYNAASQIHNALNRLNALDPSSTSEVLEYLNALQKDIEATRAGEEEAQMESAHYKLQHSLLLMDTSETTKRMEVEHTMMRRELEVLQAAELSRRASSPIPDYEQNISTHKYVEELKEWCEALERENGKLKRRLEKAKLVIADKEDELLEKDSAVQRLKDRIRQNRQHLSMLTSPGGIFESPKVPQSHSRTNPNTPYERQRATPRQTPGSVRLQQQHQIMQMGMSQQQPSYPASRHQSQIQGHAHPVQHQGGGRDSFATLLLADQVLNDQNTAPTTPVTHTPRRGMAPNSVGRRPRGAQSLSALQGAPVSGSMGGKWVSPHPLMRDHISQQDGLSGQHQSLLPPVQLPGNGGGVGQGVAGYEDTPRKRAEIRKQRRRQSRDSTISASDEEAHQAVGNEYISPRNSATGPASYQVQPQPYAAQPMGQGQGQAQQSYARGPAPDSSMAPLPAQSRVVRQLMNDDDETESEHEVTEVQVGDERLPASQASQTASAMLRRDPRQSFEMRDDTSNVATAGSVAGGTESGLLVPVQAVAEKTRALQSKLFGSVRKPGVERDGGKIEDGEASLRSAGEKRKSLPSEEEIRAKRLRIAAQEGLGLGIEF